MDTFLALDFLPFGISYLVVHLRLRICSDEARNLVRLTMSSADCWRVDITLQIEASTAFAPVWSPGGPKPSHSPRNLCDSYEVGLSTG